MLRKIFTQRFKNNTLEIFRLSILQFIPENDYDLKSWGYTFVSLKGISEKNPKLSLQNISDSFP